MNPETWQSAGLWIGVLLSASLFSLFLGEQWHSRLMQHLFVGALIGWLLVLTWQQLWWPLWIEPLRRGRLAPALVWPLAATALLALGALARAARLSAVSPHVSRWLVQGASTAGSFLVAAAATTGAIGIAQGTLGPQILTAVSTAYWLPVALVWTVIALLSATHSPTVLRRMPPPAAALLRGLLHVGRPVLLVASGMLLARIFTTRITLLTAFLERTLAALRDAGLDAWHLPFFS